MPVSDFRLAIASSRQFPHVHPDDLDLVEALRRLGVQCTVLVWNDPQADWASFDAVLVRTIWDYFEHYAAFLAWTHMLDRLEVSVINHTRLLRWNSNKRYLFDLRQQGISIIPTQVVQGRGLEEVLSSLPWHDVVIKPTVSGGAWHTARGRVDAEFQQTCRHLPKELEYLAQPFVPEIASHGEWSLLFFEGEYSHAVLKRPTTGDYRVQAQHGGITVQAEPDNLTLVAANKVLRAVTSLGYEEPAYARVDGVVADGQFLLMELEVIEPALFLSGRPDAAERFAAQLVMRLQHQATAPVSAGRRLD